MRLLSLACMVLAVLAAQTPGDPDWQTAAGGKMSFEVGFSGSFPLWMYIRFAWKLEYFQGDPLRLC